MPTRKRTRAAHGFLSPRNIVSAAMILSGCATGRVVPKTLGEAASGYGYVPLDGLGIVQSYDVFTCYEGQMPPTSASTSGARCWMPCPTYQ